MEINANAVMKNLGTFAHAYGLEPNSRGLVDDIVNRDGHVESVGILLRDPLTKRGLISCHFPVDGDVTNEMLWVMMNSRDVEAVPICTTELKAETQLRSFWRRFRDKMADDDFYLIEQGVFHMRVHRSFVKQGVIESYIPRKGYGYIRRTRKGIFFSKEWCNLPEIEEGKEVSFIPVISRKGLQARAVSEVAFVPRSGDSPSKYHALSSFLGQRRSSNA